MRHLPMNANIINLNTVDIRSWIKGPDNVYIGRPEKGLTSKWGNPHRLKIYKRRKTVVNLFQKYILRSDHLLNSISELKGKVLGCWCAPKLCHAEILHKLAGNRPVYQKNYIMDKNALDQQVSDALQAMNSVLEHIGQDLNQAPIIPIDVPTPTSLSLSTLETNKAYESILVTDSSLNSTTVETPSPSLSSSKLSSPCQTDRSMASEMADLESKLQGWRIKHGKAYHSACSSPVRRPNIERSARSAPVSPTHLKDTPLSNSDIPTICNPPDPFSFHCSTTQEPNTSILQSNRNILDFLAHKVDLLSVSINTIQFNVAKISESFGISLNEKIPETLKTMEQAFHNKFDYLQGKFDNYKSIVDKEIRSVREENAQLRENLDRYIAEESIRNDNIKECINTAPTLPCVTDIQPLRDQLEKKLMELDIRLVECEQYSRRESLIISGIPNSVKQQQLEGKVIEILRLIGLNIVPDDITACHRLFSPAGSEYPAKVIVRFFNRKVVNFCLEHRDNLQEKAYQHLRLNLRFFESLCTKNEESLRICKWLKGEQRIDEYFLRNGFVKIVGEQNGRPTKIPHPDILRQKFEGIPVAI